jgi:hypothetical protein
MALLCRHVLLLCVLSSACREREREPAPPPPPPPPTHSAIAQAALAAVAAAPWDADPTGWGILCTREAPCDTLVIEPRIVSLPSQAPAFFVPDRREVAAMLSLDALALSHVPGRQVVLGPWRECSARRDDPHWSKSGVACVALGVAGLENAQPGAMTFALLLATPARGLSWPRVRVTHPRESWRGRLMSNSSE